MTDHPKRRYVKVTIHRPYCRAKITLRMDEETDEPITLAEMARFLAEVARAAGFSYVVDVAALTRTHVVTGDEDVKYWRTRLKVPAKMPKRGRRGD